MNVLYEGVVFMVFNQGYTDFPHAQCERCENKSICKYKDKLVSVCEDISQIDTGIDIDLPVKIVVSCAKFVKEKTTVRQDVWGNYSGKFMQEE